LIKLLGAGWKKHELMVELDTLLEFNFLKYEGKGAVPSQIHHYLSHQFKACRNLEKDNTIDLEKIREAHLLHEFKQYRQSQKKRLKAFRLEVMRTGFKNAYYKTIIEMSHKIPEAALYEDEKLLQLYDLAMVRLEQ